jgi:Fic family protein
LSMKPERLMLMSYMSVKTYVNWVPKNYRKTSSRRYLFGNIENDLARALMIQLRDFWTYNSTAIEGNSLTLGETAFVLQEGLAVGGKPLKDHLEVVGHAKAIDLIYDLAQTKTRFTKQELFKLCRMVQAGQVSEVHEPAGEWKKEPNSTMGVVDGKHLVFEFASPADVPSLMTAWFDLYHDLNRCLVSGDRDRALRSHVALHVCFVRIHPFSDGNGRLARLVANLPVIRSGLPPVIIPHQQRKPYMDILAAYHFRTGRIKAGDELVPDHDALKPFLEFCEQTWEGSFRIVEAIREKQRKRNE